MALAPPRPRKTQNLSDEVPTSPLRVFAADHQPIRLLAELEGISPAELVHRALEAYLEKHRDELAELARQTQRMVEQGDLVGLGAVLSEAQLARRSARAARLAALRRQSGTD